jgi:hypothetical protein
MVWHLILNSERVFAQAGQSQNCEIAINQSEAFAAERLG